MKVTVKQAVQLWLTRADRVSSGKLDAEFERKALEDVWLAVVDQIAMIQRALSTNVRGRASTRLELQSVLPMVRSASDVIAQGAAEARTSSALVRTYAAGLPAQLDTVQGILLRFSQDVLGMQSTIQVRQLWRGVLAEVKGVVAPHRSAVAAAWERLVELIGLAS